MQLRPTHLRRHSGFGLVSGSVSGLGSAMACFSSAIFSALLMVRVQLKVFFELVPSTHNRYLQYLCTQVVRVRQKCAPASTRTIRLCDFSLPVRLLLPLPLPLSLSPSPSLSLSLSLRKLQND